MRVGIIGVGHWHSGMHAKGVLEAGAQLAGVWDPDAEAIARFIAANGGNARPDTAAVLHDRPDMIIALGRGPEAATRLGWLIEQDIPILADKPIGLSHDDVAPLAQAVQARNRFVAVALVNRIAGVIEAFGDKPAHVYFRIINGHPHRYRDWHVPWMLDPQQSGGGALRNLGVHGVDAFLTLAGAQDVRLENAALHSVFGEAIEDYAAVVLRAADGSVGVVEAGYTHPDAGGTYEFRINGPRSALVDDGVHFPSAGYVPSGRRYSIFVADTLARLRAGRPPAVSLAEFARATKLIDQAYH
jgi:predicted dehydrogenase